MFDSKFIFYIKTPPLDDLTGLLCSLDTNEKRDRSALSPYHWQILKCRMLIFSIPHILVTPHAQDKKQLKIIFKRDKTNITNLQNQINKLNIKVQLSMEVNAASLEACYKYTMQAKLAPLWNLLETNLFVADRDFLTKSSPGDAISINIYNSNDFITLELKTHKLRFEKLHLEDLSIAPRALQYFTSMADAIITETSILDAWIHVLPSLKKGQIISISKQIPASSPFNCYKDLRRHWKNIYGYRLPETEEGLYFYEVYFRPLGPQLYTYPCMCVRPAPPLLTTPTGAHGREISDRFVRDLKTAMPTLLGLEVQISSFQGLPPQILTTNIKHAPKPEDLYHNKDEDFLFEDDEKIICTPPSSNNKMDTGIINITYTQHVSLCSPTPRIQQNNNTIKNVMKPYFAPKRFNNNLTKNLEITNQKDIHHNKSRTASNQICKNMSIFESDSMSATELMDNAVIKHVPKFEKLKILSSNSNHKQANEKNKSNKNKKEVKNNKPAGKENGRIIINAAGTSTGSGIPYFSVNDDKPQMFSNSTINSQEQLLTMSQKSNKGKKKLPVDPPSDTAIKPKRAKPTVDLSTLDLPAMAAADVTALKKLNCPTLLSWLRSKNVPANSKMTKQILLDKVYQTLQLPNPQ